MDPPKQSWGKFQPLLDQLILSPERFDPISEEIVARVNASECERGDARTLIQAVRAIYETAVAASGQPTAAETCARLCQKMVNRISPAVYEEGVKNTQGKPIAGGQLFRKYLLSHCREEAERCWATKARSAGTDTDRMKQADVRGHGLGLVRFVGELFLLQMITERIIHDGYLKRLLPDTADPTEADVECLCALLTRIGPRLDTPKARKHMGVYFARMAEMAHGVNVSQRMREMLQGVIKLRARGWLTPGGPLGDERTKESGWTPTGALAETSGAAPQAKGGLPLRRPLKAGDLDNFGKPIRKQNT
ncbi:hypothetical protein FOMPIDRAFT_1163057 [Fomitopsis schrenkii]|uniref:MIF4G domain-containing protein n=1 Tax=Fomitopsis schrenkii TaxID=2126942 RepID=S8EAR6_FOMSC|nr:hypothetical protein FOMPIDRAFT_1163057 [Fomitopsis schrenkii]